jgi:hypothetical protein
MDSWFALVQQAMQELMQREVDFGWYFPSIGEYASVLEKHDLESTNGWLFKNGQWFADYTRLRIVAYKA